MKDDKVIVIWLIVGVCLLIGAVIALYTANSINTLSENFVSDEQMILTIISLPMMVIGIIFLFIGEMGLIVNMRKIPTKTHNENVYPK